MNLRLACLAFLLIPTATLSAAELRLQPQCTPHGTLITLGDVAEICAVRSEEAETLAAVELFPAPPAGQERLLRVRELQDLLLLRGINLTRHRFSGASEVRIAVSAGPEQPAGETPLSSQAPKWARRRLEEALTKHLQQQTGGKTPWKFRFELTAAQIRALANPAQAVSLSGGRVPFCGVQQFDLAVETPQGMQRFPVRVEISLPAAVVAAAHSLNRGAVIRDSDLTLVQAEDSEGNGGVFHAVEEIVGKQTSRAIPEGKILTAAAVQAPLCVRRGEAVTVYARTAGIQVRTTARAKENGSLGDLITVETLNDRKTLSARVCGIREAEVMAQAVAAERSW